MYCIKWLSLIFTKCITSQMYNDLILHTEAGEKVELSAYYECCQH